MTERSHAARLGHAREPEIEPIGEHRRHQGAVVDGRRARAQMCETFGEERPSRHFGQQVGDANARQHGVKSLGQSFGFGRRRFFERRYLQHAFVDCDVRQQAILGADVDGRQPSVEHLAAARDEALEICFDRNRQSADFLQISGMRLLKSIVPRKSGIAGCR